MPPTLRLTHPLARLWRRTDAGIATTIETAVPRSLPALPGQALRVLRGRVWVTLPGRPEDHLLCAGQSLAVPDGTRRLLVGADGGAPALVRIGR